MKPERKLEATVVLSRGILAVVEGTWWKKTSRTERGVGLDSEGAPEPLPSRSPIFWGRCFLSPSSVGVDEKDGLLLIVRFMAAEIVQSIFWRKANV